MAYIKPTRDESLIRLENRTKRLLECIELMKNRTSVPNGIAANGVALLVEAAAVLLGKRVGVAISKKLAELERKESGICVICGIEPALPDPGETYCKECLQKRPN